MYKKFFFIGLFLLTMACVTVKSDGGPPHSIEGQAARPVPYFSISIDANYDPRLDRVVPGYVLLSVAMRNVSLRSVPMDARLDRWTIINEKGKKYEAINSLHVKDPEAWRRLPEKVQNLIDYPEIIPINYSVTFDLLLPRKAILQYLRQIRYYNATWDKEFVIEKDD